MDIQQLLQNIQSPEQIDALAERLSRVGRPPAGTPGMPQPAAPAPNPMGIPQVTPAVPTPGADLGSILGEFQ